MLARVQQISTMSKLVEVPSKLRCGGIFVKPLACSVNYFKGDGFGGPGSDRCTHGQNYCTPCNFPHSHVATVPPFTPVFPL